MRLVTRKTPVSRAGGMAIRFTLAVFAFLPLLRAWNSAAALVSFLFILFCGFLCDRYYTLSTPVYILIRFLGWLPVLYVFLAIVLWDRPILLIIANSLMFWVILYSFLASQRNQIMAMNMMCGLILILATFFGRDIVLLFGIVVYLVLFLPACADALFTAAAYREKSTVLNASWKSTVVFSIVGGLAAAGIAVFVAAVMLFVPRYEIEGLSSLGRFNVYQSPMHAFRVGMGGRPLDHRLLMEVETDKPGNYRGQVFTKFSGMYWVRDQFSEPQDGYYDLSGRTSLELPAGQGEQWLGICSSYAQRFHVMEIFPTVLRYGLLRPVRYESDGNETLSLAKNGVLAGAARGGFSYTITSEVPGTQRAWQGQLHTLSPVWKVEYLQLPAISERVMELTRRVAGTNRDPWQRVLALQRYLIDNCTYDLNISTPAYIRDVVDFFLFRSRTGYCEHFATAMTIMSRIAGVPSRLVTGFAPGELNRTTERYEVRAMHAHAWTEVYLAGHGWTAIDATPPAAISRFGTGFSEGSYGIFGDWGNNIYNFVDSDQAHSRQVAFNLAKVPLLYINTAAQSPAGQAVMAVFVIVALIGAATSLLAWRSYVKRRAAARAQALRDRIQELFREVRAALENNGAPGTPGLTPREFCWRAERAALTGAWRQVAADLNQLVPEYYLHRFAETGAGHEIYETLFQQLEQLAGRCRELLSTGKNQRFSRA